MIPLSLADIQQARTRIGDRVINTPCMESKTLSNITGAQVFLKFENLQFTASFKERGACNKLSSMPESQRHQGVIAMSRGNHAPKLSFRSPLRILPL